MKLYYFPVAPNPTKVRLYLAEKRAAGTMLPIEECSVDLAKGEQRGAEHLARNPAGRLPVLELDDGGFVTESLAIIELLEELFPEPSMIGRDPATRARTRELERIADIGVLIGIARIVHATNSPLGMPPNPAVAEQAQRALPDALSRLDAVLADGRPFLAGADPTIADCTLAAALQFGRFGGVSLPDQYRHLHRWDEAFRRRPSAQSVLLA